MFTENHDVFFDDFGLAATIDGEDVRVIFDNASQTAGVGILGMSGTQPVITLKTADLPAPDPVGLAVQVGGVAYTITQHAPDGTGMSVCQLEFAA